MLGLSIAFGTAIAASGLIASASNLAYDALSALVPRTAPADIVIVAIDDESIARIGKWPWPRSTHAALIRALTAAHPRVIVYDVLFTEAGQGDAALATAIAQGPPVVLPLMVETPGANGRPVSLRRPVPPLAGPNLRVGHPVLMVDPDGISRRVRLVETVDGVRVPHVALLATGGSAGGITGDRRVAYARRGSFTTVPFSAVLDGTVPAAFLRDRIVLVGATASGLGDRYATPVSSDGGLYPGVEILANVVADISNDGLIDDGGLWGSIGLLAASSCLLAAGFLIFGPRANVVIAVLLATVMLLASAVLLSAGLWCDPAPSLLALLVLFPAWGWHQLGQATRSIDTQLARLGEDVGLLDRPAAAPGRGEDPLARRVAALDVAIARNLDLRRFVQTSFDSMPDPAIVVRPNGDVVLANGEARRLHARYDRGPMPDGMAALLARTLVTMRSGQAALLTLLKAQDGDTETATVEIETRDDRYFDASKTAFQTSRNGARFFIVRLVETTRLRRAEREREHALEFLSHDLRAPQSSIIGLLDSPGTAMLPELRSRLRALAERTIGMAQAFIDIARVRSGIVTARELDLNDVAQEVIESLWADLKARSLRSRLHASVRPLIVRADELLVARAIGNIIQNAVRFSPPHASVTVRLMARTGGDGRAMAACLIDDQGPGIARAQLLRIFDRFESGTRGTGGTGLGLAMVKATADRFGGRVRCYSRSGRGTRFVFELPLTLATDGSAPA